MSKEKQGPVGVGKSLLLVKRSCKRCGRRRLLSWMFSCPCCSGDFCYDTCCGEDECLCQNCDLHHDTDEGFYFCDRYRPVQSKPVDPDKPHPYHKCPRSKISYEYPKLLFCPNCIKSMDILPLIWCLQSIAEARP